MAPSNRHAIPKWGANRSLSLLLLYSHPRFGLSLPLWLFLFARASERRAVRRKGTIRSGAPKKRLTCGTKKERLGILSFPTVFFHARAGRRRGRKVACLKRMTSHVSSLSKAVIRFLLSSFFSRARAVGKKEVTASQKEILEKRT